MQEKNWALKTNTKDRGAITVTDILDSLLHKPAFGFEGYNPKPTHRDLIKPKNFLQAKSKRTTFADEIGIKKSHIPASTKYQTEADWAKNPETRTTKWNLAKRYTIADEIEIKSKKPEKTTPGPFAYKNALAYDFT